LNFVNHSIQKLREQIEQRILVFFFEIKFYSILLEKEINIKTQQRIDETRSRIKNIKAKLNGIKELAKLSNDENRKKVDYRDKQDKKLQYIRRERFDELITYLFPIQRVSANEE